MDTLKELFKIGAGPSSSHTIGPERATKRVKEKFPNADSYIVELWGSLAATGKGHYTDKIIIETFKPIPVEIVWMPEFVHELHPNGMKFIALDKDKKQIGEWIVFSVGGGTIKDYDELMDKSPKKEIYPLNSMNEIIKWCKDNKKHLWQYVEECEGPSIWQHLRYIDQAMTDAVKRGLEKSGDVPGPFKYPKRAREMYEKALSKRASLIFTNKVFAYALAVSEENASMGQVVTAPTCGASGVIPGVLRGMKEEYELVEKHILRGLAIAGLIGNLVKQNATISGAEGGCQAEVGSASAMSAAALTLAAGGSPYQASQAIAFVIKNMLGLICDPVAGLVEVPCVKRNAMGASFAFIAADMALAGIESKIPVDEVIDAMYQVGSSLPTAFRETAEGGLAATPTGRRLQKEIFGE